VNAPSRPALVVTVLLFALLYGWSLFQAISNLSALPAVYDYCAIADATPWPLLVAGVAIPVVLFAVALVLGRGRELFARVLLLAVGFGATSALALSATQIVTAIQPPCG
jgi:hypothetical protein